MILSVQAHGLNKFFMLFLDYCMLVCVCVYTHIHIHTYIYLSICVYVCV